MRAALLCVRRHARATLRTLGLLAAFRVPLPLPPSTPSFARLSESWGADPCQGLPHSAADTDTDPGAFFAALAWAAEGVEAESADSTASAASAGRVMEAAVDGDARAGHHPPTPPTAYRPARPPAASPLRCSCGSQSSHFVAGRALGEAAPAMALGVVRAWLQLESRRGGGALAEPNSAKSDPDAWPGTVCCNITNNVLTALIACVSQLINRSRRFGGLPLSASCFSRGSSRGPAVPCSLYSTAPRGP